jgi:hypothetical protein
MCHPSQLTSDRSKEELTHVQRLLLAVLCGAFSSGSAGLEIDPLVIPEINIGGRALVTINGIAQGRAFGATDTDAKLDISDSSLLFGFSKYLFSDTDYGFGMIGIRIPEDDSEVGEDIFIHQALVGIGGRRYEIRLGRSRLPNTLVSFPTLRDDDLLEFAYVLNGMANAAAEEFQIFGGQIAGTWWATPIVYARAAALTRRETNASGEETTSSNFNGAAFTLAYDVPEAIKFDRGVRFAGLTVDYQWLDELAAAPDDTMRAVVAGTIYNLNSNPEAAWSLDLQGIYNFGAQVTDLAEEVQRARAESGAILAGLRFVRRPYLQTRWQAAVSVGWKGYSDFDEATSLVVAPSFAYRLGSGVDLLIQYLYRYNDDGLAKATGINEEHTVFVGLSFLFAHTFNETVGQRGDILNVEHDVLDNGPVFGGH